MAHDLRDGGVASVDAEATLLQLSPCARFLTRTMVTMEQAGSNCLRELLRRTYYPRDAPGENWTKEETLAAVAELLSLDVIEVHPDCPLPGGGIGDGYALTNWGFFVRQKLL